MVDRSQGRSPPASCPSPYRAAAARPQHRRDRAGRSDLFSVGSRLPPRLLDEQARALDAILIFHVSCASLRRLAPLLYRNRLF